MHVLFVTEWLPTPEQPIYGIFILEHARAIARLHRVSVLHIQGVDPSLNQAIHIQPEVIDQNITIYRLSYRKPWLPRTAWIRQINGARQAVKLAASTYGKPDIVHGNVHNTADVCVIVGRLARVPVVLTEHSSAYARQLIPSAKAGWIRYFMNRVDVLMPVCKNLGEYMRRFGVTRPMVPVPNVADPEIFYPASRDEQVIQPMREISMVARLGQEKAVHLAIQALAQLKQQGIDLYLHIAGEGPERGSLEALVSDLGLPERVCFHGNLAKNDLAKMMRRSSLFMLSSLWENQPVVILEALACGLPIIAPQVGGIPEVITAKQGLLFRPGDVDDLTAKLISLLTNLSSYDPQAIRQYSMDNFSPDVVAKRFDFIYQGLLKRRQYFEHLPDGFYNG